MAVSRRVKIKIAKKAVLAVLVVAFVGTLIYANNLKSDNNDLKNQLNSAKSETESAGKKTEQKPAETKSEKDLPLYVFTPEGVFSDQEKEELKTKLLDPFKDYAPGKYVALVVEIYSRDKFLGADGDDKYIFSAIGYDATEGFLYGSKKKGLDYWVPQCLDKCEFSDEYRAKYPEVVKKYEEQN